MTFITWIAASSVNLRDDGQHLAISTRAFFGLGQYSYTQTIEYY